MAVFLKSRCRRRMESGEVTPTSVAGQSDSTATTCVVQFGDDCETPAKLEFADNFFAGGREQPK